MRHLVTAMKSCALEQLHEAIIVANVDRPNPVISPVSRVGIRLLSLGNVFHKFESIDYVVVDEGGQCHPAYVVSAFMRQSTQ